MSRMLSKMNLISVVQQLPKEDIQTIQGYVEMIEQENEKLKADYGNKAQVERDLLLEENKKLKEVIDKAINELFILKDMIYKPETREENFEIQRKISSIIKRLNSKEVE